MSIFYTDSASFSDVSVSGSLLVSGSLSFLQDSGGLTGSLLGTSSWAQSSSIATTASYIAPSGLPSGVVSSSSQISTGSFTGSFTGSALITTSLLVSGSVTASGAVGSTVELSVTNPAGTGFLRTQTGLPIPVYIGSSAALGFSAAGQIFAVGTSTQFYPNPDLTVDLGTVNNKWKSIVAGNVSASIVSASTAVTASNVQLNGLTDTTTTNKVLVLDTTTNKIFTTASVGGGGSVGSTFPYDGRTTPALISGSVTVSSSLNTTGIRVTGSVSVISGSISSSGGFFGTSSWATNAASASYFSGSIDFPSGITGSITTASYAQTASFALNAGGGSGFPFSGTAIITGSLLVSKSNAIAITSTGSIYSFDTVNSSSYIAVQNVNSGISASADLWLVNNLGSITTNTYNMNVGINSSTYNVPNQIGVANEAYVSNTGSNLLIGNQTTGTNANIKFFSGNQGTSFAMTVTGSTVSIPTSLQAPSITGSIFSGSATSLLEMSLAVSGAITASGTTTVNLNLNQANFFTVSASAAGTITWQITNPPVTGRAQTFVIEYTNGGIKTNNWFTGTRWPAGVAPTLSSASANPDLLSFTTDDAGTNWRGVLLQRGSA